MSTYTDEAIDEGTLSTISNNFDSPPTASYVFCDFNFSITLATSTSLRLLYIANIALYIFL